MGSGWENPGPARQVIIDGKLGQLLVYNFSLRELGTLMLSLSGEAGSDPYGNTFPKGLYFPIDFVGQVGPQHSEYVQWGDTFGVVLASLFLQRANAGQPPELHILVQNDGSNLGRLILSTAGKNNGAGVQIGNGKPGLAHSVSCTWFQSQASGSVTPIGSPTVQHTDSDYPTSGFSAGAFSPPVDGWYDFHLMVNNPPSGGTRMAAIILVNGTEVSHEENQNGAHCSASLNAQYLVQSDVVTFVPFYNSTTTPQNLTGLIYVSRRVT